jgi:hypothetical protein
MERRPDPEMTARGIARLSAKIDLGVEVTCTRCGAVMQNWDRANHYALASAKKLPSMACTKCKSMLTVEMDEGKSGIDLVRMAMCGQGLKR